MEILREKNFNKIKDFVKKNSGKKIMFSSDDDDLNRRVLEKAKVDIILLSQKNRKDFQKQRNSGLNEIMSKIAKKNKIKIGIDFDEIIESSGKIKVDILGRIRQNIFLCKKSKIEMKFICQKYKRDVYDLKALGLILGMPTWMTKGI